MFGDQLGEHQGIYRGLSRDVYEIIRRHSLWKKNILTFGSVHIGMAGWSFIWEYLFFALNSKVKKVKFSTRGSDH